MIRVRTLSKLSTALLIPLTFAMLSCSRPQAEELHIQEGPAGTYIALGLDVEGTISNGSTTFDFKKAIGGGVSVGVATDGPYPQSKDAEKLFKPASITKLVTTSLALKTLGPNFKYSTNVYISPGSSDDSIKDLTIIANGDPQVVKSIVGQGVGQQKVLAAIAEQLKEQGVIKIEGHLNLLAADERRDHAQFAMGIEEGDKQTCDSSVAQSFNLNWNCFAIRPAKKILPVLDVKQIYGATLLQTLSESGIDVSTASVTMPVGEEADELRGTLSAEGSFAVESDPVSDIVRFANKPSDNFLADTLYKTLGEKHGDGEDLRLEAQAAVRESVSDWLKKAGHQEYSNEIHLVDGAGLSQENRVSARAYMALLKEFTKEPTFSHLWNSLPIAGVDGTLKIKMNGTEAQGKVRAKTGTLRGSYQLAGYIPKFAADGRTVVDYVPFVILSATTPDKRFDVFDLQTQLAVKLLKLVNP